MLFIFAAISLGFLGSFHCIGMCGPIALALPVLNRSPLLKIISVLTYNFGRAFTYASLGLFFGLVGNGFAIFGLQQILSISLGSIILLTLILPKDILFRFSITKQTSRLFFNLRSRLSALFHKKNFSSLFAIGLLNGLLPCGLVYMAIAGAIATGSALKGAAFMAAFGLGTIPVMFSLSWFSNLITVKFRSGINKALPYFISAMAVLMILRGLNLGIPYLSPEFNAKNKTMSCCEKKESGKDPKSIIDCCHKK
jgi:sulfite exporter TauE/SafE